jgi:hypothetical protein
LFIHIQANQWLFHCQQPWDKFCCNMHHSRIFGSNCLAWAKRNT